MNVFCPGCGARISAAPSPLDEEGMVTCPKCKSRFPTSGVVATAAAEPKRKFKPKKKAGRAWIVAGVIVLAIVLLGGTAAALYYGGVFGRSPSNPSGGFTTTKGAAAEWHEFTSVEGKFRVQFPAAPTRLPRPKKDIEFRADTLDLQASVVFADLAEKDKPDKYMVAPAGATVLSEKDVSQGDNKGREIVAEIVGKGTVHMRYFAAGKRLYTVMIVGKSKPASDADVARLFDSFQITG